MTICSAREAVAFYLGFSALKIGNAFALQAAMRNVLGSFTVAVVATLGVSVPAAASTIAYQDTFAPAPVSLSAASVVACTGTNALVDSVAPVGTPEFPCLSLAYSHQFTLGEFDTLDSATLTVYFMDDGGPADGSEKFTLTGDGTSFWTTEEPGGSGNSVQPYGPLSVFAQMLGDNKLDILVTANVGDLIFLQSTLDYVVTSLDPEDPGDLVPTPEPASLLLFGAGAIIIAARVRKARRS